MPMQTYVNLAVKDLQKSIAFFRALGFSFEPRFTNESGACMIVSENTFVMLLAEGFFKTFITKEVCDARKSTEILIALACASRGEVDELATRALRAGARISRDAQEQGGMYGLSFEDLDGHIWELFHMSAEMAAHGAAAAGRERGRI